jgi:competence protein ComEC
MLVAAQIGVPLLEPGQRLLSPGLAVEALAADSQALLLSVGRLHWGLLPDRQAWWSWRDLNPSHRPQVSGLWLGFSPRPAERRQLPPLQPDRLWWPVAGSPSGWRQA